MAVELKLPEVGENIESGEIVKVLVKVGDHVEKDQPLLELETGKATVEVPASVGGTVAAIHVQQGQTAKVGQLLVTLEEAPGARPAPEAAQRKEPARTAATSAIPQEAKPLEQEPKARAGEPKPAAEPAPAPSREEPRPAAPPAPAAPPPAPSAGTAGAVAAPHVRQFAREIGVDIGQVSGSGPGGRISVEDVKRHARSSGGPGPAPAAAAGPLPDFTRFGQVEREPLSGIRKVIAQQMARSWQTVPTVVLQAKADVTDLEAFRQKHKAKAEAAGGKLTMTAILVKVAAAGLRAFPRVNASLDAARQELVVKKYFHIGVAVDTPRGLLVPPVRDADRKSLVQIGAELSALSAKAREGRLSPSELEGASFTVTNLGGLGIGHFSAIINPPEVAILAVGRAETEPVWRGGEFVPRLMLPLTLCIDHRVLDGADGARFLSWIVEAVEQPLLLALEG